MYSFEYAPEVKAIGPMSRAKRLRVYRRLERVRNAYERSTRSQFRTIFGAERNAVLELEDPDERTLFEAVQKSRDTKQRVLQNMNMRVAVEVRPMVDEHLTARAWSQQLHAKAIGVEGEIDENDLWAVEMRRWIAENTAWKVTQIDETTMNKLRELLQQATSVVDFRERVDALYLDEIIPRRSSVIARTETTAASNATSIQTVRSLQSARTEYKTWNTCLDAEVRDTHMHMEGRTIERDDLYSWTGKYGAVQMDYPVDWGHGAPAGECVNCRCFLTFSAE